MAPATLICLRRTIAVPLTERSCVSDAQIAPPLLKLSYWCDPRAVRPLEKTDVRDPKGTKIGERVVWDSPPPSEAEVTWNEGAKLFEILAPSLQDALTFEKSNVWKNSGCWDFRSFK